MKIYSTRFVGFILAIPVAQCLSGQTYLGVSENKYNVVLRIENDTTAYFMYNTANNISYGEFHGTLKKTSDTLYHVSFFQDIGIYPMKTFHNDTLYMEINPLIATTLDVIEVEFTNDTRTTYQGMDNLGKAIPLLAIPFKKTVFNSSSGSNYVTVTINRKNFERDDFFGFRINYGSGARISRGEIVELDLVIKKNVVYSVGTPYGQIGGFRLMKKVTK